MKFIVHYIKPMMVVAMTLGFAASTSAIAAEQSAEQGDKGGDEEPDCD